MALPSNEEGLATACSMAEVGLVKAEDLEDRAEESCTMEMAPKA